MLVSEIKNSISSLPGVGPATATLFANLNIFTVGDLLTFYPRDYEDRTHKITILDGMKANSKAHTIAVVTGHEYFGFGRMKTLKILIRDSSTAAELVAFNRPFLEKSLPVGTIIAVTAQFSVKYGRVQASQFDYEKISQEGNIEDFQNAPVPNSRIFPVYHLTEGLSRKIVEKAVNSAIKAYSAGIDTELPKDLIEKYRLLPKNEAIRKIHNPLTLDEANSARRTLIFEELYNFQLTLARRAIAHRGKLPDEKASSQNEAPVSQQDFEKSLSPRQKNLLARLSFELTPDQKTVIFKMNEDIDSAYHAASMNREKPFSMRTLLQGDVGSGKTLTAFFACLRCIDYGSQCAFMAPTELLARQHAENAAKQLQILNVNVAYLTGNIKASGRAELLKALKNGEIDLVIGTHALFSKNVVYKDLALAVIDEQHRFGVMQRESIVQKGRDSADGKVPEPNLLMMSATPIPQTLALTVFGDLDVRTIHTMPGGRKPVITYLTRQGNERNAYEAVRKELMAGRQAYFVYPAIEAGESSYSESESGEGKKALKAAEEMFEFLTKQVYPGFSAALIHSQVDEEKQNQILSDFSAGKIQILVATTVVEVGVDVANATCMVIEQADRFGLAALHQLRGRVGRGNLQSYCFLIYSKNLSENGIERMKILHETTDGFKIAEEDLKLRGPGEITGTAQSGELTFALADPVRDSKIMEAARKCAFEKAAGDL